MHHEDDTQSMLLSSTGPFGLGLGTIRQALPFQISTSVCPTGPFGVFVEYEPTAAHHFGDTHETLSNLPLFPMAGAVVDHFFPFQRINAPSFVRARPTAMQNERDVHETPAKLAFATGTGTCFHAVPFQCSISGRSAPSHDPTAWHHFASTHDTPQSQASRGPELGTTFHFEPVPDIAYTFDTASCPPSLPTAVHHPDGRHEIADSVRLT